jgi:hypothetical protein
VGLVILPVFKYWFYHPQFFLSLFSEEEAFYSATTYLLNNYYLPCTVGDAEGTSSEPKVREPLSWSLHPVKRETNISLLPMTLEGRSARHERETCRYLEEDSVLGRRNCKCKE